MYIVATPIGNLQDISFRAIEVLKKSKIILCEKPSHSLKLLKEYGIKTKLISIHDFNEEKIIKKISIYLENSIISLISDAGSPLISDPGYKLVSYCINRNIYITSIPGPTSIISAIQLSGIPSNSFTFNGFIPKKTKQAEAIFEISKNNYGAQIFFSSSHRLLDNIKLLKKHFGNRRICICKELTKINEQVIKTKIDKLIDEVISKKVVIKGEFVLVIEGRLENKKMDIKPETIELLTYLSKKISLTESVKIVHKLTGLSKKILYNEALLEKKKYE